MLLPAQSHAEWTLLTPRSNRSVSLNIAAFSGLVLITVTPFCWNSAILPANWLGVFCGSNFGAWAVHMAGGLFAAGRSVSRRGGDASFLPAGARRPDDPLPLNCPVRRSSVSARTRR